MELELKEKNSCNKVRKDTEKYGNMVALWLKHYDDMYSRKLIAMESTLPEETFSKKERKFHRKKMEYRYIVLRSLKQRSLRLSDNRKLKIRRWCRLDEEGNKQYNENGSVKKVERYDIISLIRILKEAQDLGEDVFYEFLNLYDVRKILDTVMEDYFGDLQLFLERKTL